MSAAPGRRALPFGAERRIATQSEYEDLLRNGARKSRFGFTFIFAPGRSGAARLGILMSRKVSPRAHVRNRVKRCIREAFRVEQAGLAVIDVLVRPPQNIRVERDLFERLRAAFAGFRA